jgi:hypothetical protein
MSVEPHDKEFDRNLQPREHPSGFRSLSLRKRIADHPLVMFVVIVTTAFASMALVPTSGPAFASIGKSHHVVARVSDEPRTTAKADRLQLGETDIACSGQAWGAESEDCLKVIARQSGKSATRPIRLIAAGEPDLSTPNVF